MFCLFSVFLIAANGVVPNPYQALNLDFSNTKAKFRFESKILNLGLEVLHLDMLCMPVEKSKVQRAEQRQ